MDNQRELDPYAPPRLEAPAGHSSPEIIEPPNLVISVQFESERSAFQRSPAMFGAGTVRVEPWGLALIGQTTSMKGRALKALAVVLGVLALGLVIVTQAFVVTPVGIILGLIWVAGGRIYTPGALSLPWSEIRAVYTYGAGLQLDTSRGELKIFPERRTPYWAAHQAALQQLGVFLNQRVGGGRP